MDTNMVVQYTTYGLAAIGILAFFVAVIVQVIKELPVLDKLPTSAVALVVSLILCPTALLALCAYRKIAVAWYYVAASVVAAFPVYLAATGGWVRLRAIWERTRYEKEKKE